MREVEFITQSVSLSVWGDLLSSFSLLFFYMNDGHEWGVQ